MTANQSTPGPRIVRQLAARLRKLRAFRRKRKERLRHATGRRMTLSPKSRAAVLIKTNGRCHICGVKVRPPWQADHVFARSVGGVHSPDNYLPAHALCNNYRWDYSEKEFQMMLKLGVWLANEIRRESRIGNEAGALFLRKEIRRHSRRRT